MKTQYTLSLTSALFVLFFAAQAPAEIIIRDTFTAPDSTSLIGRTPDSVNLPGGKYQVQGSTGWETIVQNDRATMGADVGVGVSLASTGGYTKSTLMEISATINEGTWTDDGFTSRVADLGFYNSTIGTGGHGFAGFTGLALNTQGVLTLIQPDAVSDGSSAAVPGFNTAIDHTLSYDVNTVTGAISSIVLDGNAVTLTTAANPFTDAATAFAGFAGSSSTGGPVGTFDNFTVQSIPEPSALLLLTAGAAAVAMIRLRRKA